VGIGLPKNKIKKNKKKKIKTESGEEERENRKGKTATSYAARVGTSVTKQTKDTSGQKNSQREGHLPPRFHLDLAIRQKAPPFFHI